MPLAAGIRLGAYEIVSLIGAGGMGEVYRARDTRLGRTVAIKVLSAAASEDDSARQRLFREARTISSLDHPYICALYDIGRENGIDYLVMQHLEGETLAAVLRQGPLEIETAVRYASEIGDALDAAHSRGIVHRDLKPANVMITAAGARLLDFGLAMPRPARESASPDLNVDDSTRTVITGPGKVLGTLPYMAPEQLEGQPADARSDIFSFGAMFYEMLTGRRPFIATADAGVMTQILGVMPPPPSSLNRAVPPAVDVIVTRCLAKTPADRWQTVRAVLNALTIALSESHRSRAIQWGYAAAAAAVLVIVVAAGLPYLNRAALTGAAVATEADSTTLAILPFEIDTDDPGERAFWNGLGQAVAAKLGRLPAGNRLHVIAASEIAARKVRTPRDARAELGATHVIQGQASPTAVQVRLIDTRSGESIRTIDINADRRDPVSSQNALTDGVLSLLELRVTARDRANLSAPQAAAGAYDFYLQALGYLQDFDKPENLDTAITVLMHALKIDPRHAPAQAGLGQAYWRKYLATREIAWVEKARQACLEALGLDDAEAAPHACLGTVENGVGRHQKGAEEFTHALEREPENEAAYLGLAASYRALRDNARAEENYRRAIALRPRYWASYSRAGEFYFSAGRYDDAQRMFEQVIALSPDSWRGYSNLGAIYLAQNRTSEALATFKRSLAIRPNFQAASNLGTLYFYEESDYAKAADAFKQALAINDNEHVVWGNYAAALEWAGQLSAAKEAYAKAIGLAESRRQVNARDASVVMSLAEYRAGLNDLAAARTLMAEALTIGSTAPDLLFDAAVLYEHRFGDRGQALHFIERALAAGLTLNKIERSPSLKALRMDSRFKQLFQHAAAQRAARS